MGTGNTVESAAATSGRRPHVIRRLYDWTLHWAETPHATWALFGLALAESSVFPVPPDVLLIALTLGNRPRAWWYAAVCSAGSVIGGVVGYALGALAWHVLEPVFIPYIFRREVFERVVDWYNAGAFWYVLIAAFTPIPYKVFTVAAGVCQIPLWILVAGSVVGRTARFVLVAGLLYWFGPPVRVFVEKHFDRLMWVFLALLILGFVAVKYLR